MLFQYWLELVQETEHRLHYHWRRLESSLTHAAHHFFRALQAALAYRHEVHISPAKALGDLVFTFEGGRINEVVDVPERQYCSLQSCCHNNKERWSSVDCASMLTGYQVGNLAYPGTLLNERRCHSLAYTIEVA